MTDAARAERPVVSRSAADVVERVVENLQRAVRAPRATLELCVLCVLAEGHLIIEDFPGVGKTVLAKSVDLRRVVRHEPHARDPYRAEHGRGDSVVPRVRLEPKQFVRLKRVVAQFLEPVGP
jgi:hypothetical protein